MIGKGLRGQKGNRETREKASQLAGQVSDIGGLGWMPQSVGCKLLGPLGACDVVASGRGGSLSSRGVKVIFASTEGKGATGEIIHVLGEGLSVFSAQAHDGK